MHEAMYYHKEKDNVVKCVLCPRDCFIQEDQIGFCNVRKNVNGKLVTLIYGRTAGGLSIDPIEKKPLFHFLPGTGVLSFGTVGCNLRCKHCQNWNTSQVKAGQFFEKSFSPERIVEMAVEQGVDSIAYTYNEPTIFYEYMLNTAKLAKKEGIKNTMVSNGFINQPPLKKLCKYIDAVNVDLKGFNNFFYGKTTTAWLKPVQETLITLKKNKVWFEITNLMIPSLNDDLNEIKKMCEWIKSKLGVNNPLHFTAFHPDYELGNLPATPITTLVNAYDIAKAVGLNYVYVGNVMTQGYENTNCPKCNTLLIERMGFRITQNNLNNGKCFKCNHKIHGVFK
ncbi:AmmeMemoRadiSam system radical SAM enzyme [Bacteroidota bacterium]